MKRVLSLAIIALVLAAVVRPASAANVDVCSTCPHTTLESAVNAAQRGDTIRLAQGVYDSEDVQIAVGNITIRGGYENSSFTTRNPELFPTVVRSLYVTYFVSGSVAVDGLVITGSPTTGFFVWAPNASVTVTNCKLHHNTGGGFAAALVGALVFSNNIVWSNGPWPGVDVSDDGHTSVTITDNTIHTTSCSGCFGISMTNAKSADVIARNLVYDTDYGFHIRASHSSQSPLIEWNIARTNSLDGFYLDGGNPRVFHNLAFDNGGSGLSHILCQGGVYRHNVFARNAHAGMRLSGGSSAVRPEVRDNIFAWNDTGYETVGSSNGWGGTNILPVLENNGFWLNTRSEMVHGTVAPWGFEDETPGSYGELNGPVWSRRNVYVDPRFVDAVNGDFHLRSDSFLVDEGSPDGDYGQELAPNGSRVNIGLYGNTAAAERPAASPQIADLEATWDGENVAVTFDVSAPTATYWLKVEFQVDGAWTTVAPTALSGSSVVQGYQLNRLPAGNERAVLWTGARSAINDDRLGVSVRITLSHGNVSEVAVCSLAAFAPPPVSSPMPTPTPPPTTSPTPQPTATAVPTSQPTAAPSQAPTVAPTAAPSAAPTPQPTATPRPTATPKPTPVPRYTLQLQTRTADGQPIASTVIRVRNLAGKIVSSPKTNKLGVATIARLPAGTYTLSPSGGAIARYSDEALTVQLSENLSQEITGVFLTYSISGTVTRSKVPVAGVVVSDPTLGSVVTGADGTYQLTGALYGASYFVTAAADGMVASPFAHRGKFSRDVLRKNFALRVSH